LAGASAGAGRGRDSRLELPGPIATLPRLTRRPGRGIGDLRRRQRFDRRDRPAARAARRAPPRPPGQSRLRCRGQPRRRRRRGAGDPAAERRHRARARRGGGPARRGVAPRILQLEGERTAVAAARLYSIGQALTRDGRAVELGAGEAQGPAAARPREVFGVCGAACLLRRELFDRLGGYDERYFAFYEDVDLNVRARILGWRFAYAPEAIVWHLGNASWHAQAAVARNRIATQAKFMPARALPRIAAVEVGSIARAAGRHRLGPTLAGKLEGLRWLPAMLRDRRRLAAEGDLGRARSWLGRV
jgi:hypothetical protein